MIGNEVTRERNETTNLNIIMLAIIFIFIFKEKKFKDIRYNAC